MHRQFNRGSVAPLALLFTLVSMSFTAAYLKNSFSQSAMEKYRYAEWRALYAAEAGLNDVGIIILPKITSDTLIIQSGVDYGKDENNQPVGMYKDIACSTRLQINSTRKEYIAYATGVAEYTTPSGTDVSIERRVYTTMVPQGFEEFMYFTHKEEPIGPGNTGVVNFGNNDVLEGKVHTNGVMTMSNFCNPGPTFSGEVNITFEAIEQNGSAINMGGCSDEIFLDEDENTIIDTVSTIIFPPSNSAQVARENATKVFGADQKLFRSGKKDTLIMTEINFVPGGYWATQWWYNIPPVGSPPAEYDYFYDSLAIGINDRDDGRLHLGANNQFDFDIVPPTYPSQNPPPCLMISGIDATGSDITQELQDLVNSGDLIRIENAEGTSWIQFIATGNNIAFSPALGIFFDPLTLSSSDEPFLDDEPVKFINTSASTGLAEDVEWNSYNFYHDHLDNGVDFCEAGRIQHFDFEYWNFGGISGNNCDIFSCPDIIYNSDYVYMNRTFFSAGNSPQVIYIRGGQVLVRGIVDGLYTIVTDDYTEYRRHDDNDIIDRVWGNIWLIDDIVYMDSDADGAVVHPVDGGSNNVLGLMAGGSVIIANTRPNGARDQLYDSDININASILAMHGGFIAHYWQNTLADYHNPTTYSANGMTTVIADGRGGHRNNYRIKSSSPPNYGGVFTADSDYRGYVNLYGSIVQFKRGYMKRNYPGPYPVNAPGLGYDKNYHYDWNLQIKPPPYFPDLQSSDDAVILKMASYGEAKNSIE
tara:strand:- start:37 stop:2310 length:2274 start_codon:yes stop_codon:yes gene_type:complete